ncbi:MAG: ion transporter [Pirellulaceae bacterium]
MKQGLNRSDVRLHEVPLWQRSIMRFFGRPWVEVTIGVLIVVSVILTLVEFALTGGSFEAAPSLTTARLETANNVLTIVFSVELLFRFLGAPSKIRFFREFWIDILAVLPLFRVFRAARVVRLLRLVRVLRLFGVVSRLRSHFPYVLRRGLVEYLFVCGLLVVTVLFGTGAMMFFEGRATPGEGDSFDLTGSFWFSLYSLFAGEPIPATPHTIGGKLVAVFVMFMGLTIFAMFTGTVSAFMVERFREEGRFVDWDQLEDHIVICGWNSKSEIIVQEYRASTVSNSVPIVVIAQLEADQTLGEIGANVHFLNDDFTRVPALEKAGIHRARTCIILSDISGGRSEQDADARTILAALTVEKLNPAVYTCAELLNRSYGTHLTMGHVNDYVVSGEYSAYMLAQAAMNRGLMGVFTELLTYQRGNEFYRLDLPDKWHGRTFLELFVELKKTRNVTLVAVHPEDGEMLVNPAEHTFGPGDEVVVIAEHELKL